MSLCTFVCNSVTDKQIIKAAEKGASTLEDLSEELNVATCCGRCATCAKKVLREAHARTSNESALVMMNGLNLSYA